MTDRDVRRYAEQLRRSGMDDEADRYRTIFFLDTLATILVQDYMQKQGRNGQENKK